jgi:hypothetical protein
MKKRIIATAIVMLVGLYAFVAITAIAGEIRMGTILEDSPPTHSTATVSSVSIMDAGSIERIVIDVNAASTQIFYLASGDGYKLYGPVTNTESITIVKPMVKSQDKTGTDLSDYQYYPLTTNTMYYYTPLVFNDLKLVSWSASANSKIHVYVTYEKK